MRVAVYIATNPVAAGLVASYARPGGNVTGLFFQHLELLAKRFGLYKEMLPSVGRVAVFVGPRTSAGGRTRANQQHLLL